MRAENVNSLQRELKNGEVDKVESDFFFADNEFI